MVDEEIAPNLTSAVQNHFQAIKMKQGKVSREFLLVLHIHNNNQKKQYLLKPCLTTLLLERRPGEKLRSTTSRWSPCRGKPPLWSSLRATDFFLQTGSTSDKIWQKIKIDFTLCAHCTGNKSYVFLFNDGCELSTKPLEMHLNSCVIS